MAIDLNKIEASLEDKIFYVITDEQETFRRENPSKVTNDLWQRAAAKRIAALIQK